MLTSVVGYPRVGSQRELKFASEKYFKGEIIEAELLAVGKKLREQHVLSQKKSGIDFIPSNTFSYYDCLLDTAYLLGIVPERYKKLGLSEIDTYFAMARGYRAFFVPNSYAKYQPELPTNDEGERPFNG